MKVYVTGAKGFAGSYFVTYLNSLGFEVFASSANLLDKYALESELMRFQPEYVVHLAASSFVASSDVDRFYMVNVIGTRNLLEAVSHRCQNILKVIITSSAAVYGKSANEHTKELDLPLPSNDYAISKLAMELVCSLWAERLPILIARPFNFTGVGQSVNFVIPKIVQHFKSGDKKIALGNVSVSREFGDVRDFVESYYLLLTLGCPGKVYNICTGVLYTLRDIVRICEEITGHSIDIILDQTLIRSGEIERLGGDPTFLNSTIKRTHKYSINETLEWMINA